MRQKLIYFPKPNFFTFAARKKDRKTERPKDRKTERPKDRKTERPWSVVLGPWSLLDP
jgi:hypothetical protein